ncbi:hypothetical protein J1614_003555 [Plenodomus biglobosus]|nr:hypothetical protein J1614_003555 [Plenodomus biglobosus]
MPIWNMCDPPCAAGSSHRHRNRLDHVKSLSDQTNTGFPICVQRDSSSSFQICKSIRCASHLLFFPTTLVNPSSSTSATAFGFAATNAGASPISTSSSSLSSSTLSHSPSWFSSLTFTLPVITSLPFLSSHFFCSASTVFVLPSLNSFRIAIISRAVLTSVSSSNRTPNSSSSTWRSITSTSSVSVSGSDAKRSDIWPASQSRLSEESGPPHWFCTATVRSGQLNRACQMPRSNLDWRCSGALSG